MHVFCKNARLNGPAKLAELISELDVITWDIVFFSETRAASEVMNLDDGHRLYLFRTESVSAGVGILLHKRLVPHVQAVKYISDRILRVDVQIGKTRFACCAIYVPHAGYPAAYLDEVYEQILQTLTVARRSGCRILLGGDFNTQWVLANEGENLQSWQQLAICVARMCLVTAVTITHGRLGQVRDIEDGLTLFWSLLRFL